MCPICIAAAAQVAVGATSTGGLIAIAVKKLRTRMAIKSKESES
jgi:hypothetical protein